MAEQVPVLALVTSSDELPKPKLFEVVGEVLEEVADPRIVAVAVDDLVLEVLSIVLQFSLDVGQLRVELILLRSLGAAEPAVRRVGDDPPATCRESDFMRRRSGYLFKTPASVATGP